MQVIERNDFQKLLTALENAGYTLLGPVKRDGAIVLDTFHTVDALPGGWNDVQDAASYGLERRSDGALFAYTVGPVSWKKFLFPPRAKLFTATRSGKGFTVAPEPAPGSQRERRYAFVGVRSCELHALEIQDRVFADGEYADPGYTSLREQAFIVAVNCVRAGGTCFCVSMDTGPKARKGYDLALTEILEEGSHYFVVEAGSERGEALLRDVPHRVAAREECDLADSAVTAAANSMGRVMHTENLKEGLLENIEHREWDDVSKRCLACTNCTMVCPTCFCSTVEDVTDLSGTSAERWRRWDSCFTMDFSRVAGGNTRHSTRSRYRQWMMHKLSYWVDQFGVMGCVGCGRCITWCPAGIDITVEAQAILGSRSSATMAAAPEHTKV